MSSETTPRFQTLCLSTTKSSSLVTTPFYLIASTITRHTLSPFHQTFFLIKHCSFSKGAVLVTVEVFDTVLCSLFFLVGERGGGGGVGLVYLLSFETMTLLFVHSYGRNMCHLSESSLGEGLILLMVWIWCSTFLGYLLFAMELWIQFCLNNISVFPFNNLTFIIGENYNIIFYF